MVLTGQVARDTPRSVASLGRGRVIQRSEIIGRNFSDSKNCVHPSAGYRGRAEWRRIQLSVVPRGLREEGACVKNAN